MSAWWEPIAVRHAAEATADGKAWLCACWRCKAGRAAGWTPPSVDLFGQLAWQVRLEAERYALEVRTNPKTLAHMCAVVSATLVFLARAHHLRAELVMGRFSGVEEWHFWTLGNLPRRLRRGWEARAVLVDLAATQYEHLFGGVPRFVRLAPDDELRGLYASEETGPCALAAMTAADTDHVARLLPRVAAAMEKAA
jgi:hypothetical protein